VEQAALEALAINFMSLPNPSWDELFMRHAYLISSKSKDARTRIGAVLVKDRRVISEGYNGLPANLNDDVPMRQQRPNKYFFFEHAERNAVFGCARVAVSSLGSIMYTCGIPCADCARAVIQGGIVELIVHKQWQENEVWIRQGQWSESCNAGKEMLLEAGVKIRDFDQALGLKTLMDGQVIEV
jgi:dCMP deaminase